MKLLSWKTRRFIRAAAVVAAFAAAGAAADPLEKLLRSHEVDARILDVSCSINSSGDDCASHVAASSGASCVWCPEMNVCLNDHQTSVLEKIGVSCGEEKSRILWDNARRCHEASTTQKNCLAVADIDADDGNGHKLSSPSCMWCVSEDPKFGVCMSQEIHSKFSGASRPGAENILEDLLKCQTEGSPEATSSDANGVHDMSCLRLNAYERDACEKGRDASGYPCSFVDHFFSADEVTRNIDVGSLCLSQAQEAVANSFIKAMHQAILKWFIMPKSVSADRFGD